MSVPTLPDVNSKHGAPMGRPETPARWPSIPRKFYLQRVPLDSGGYDRGGAYWGLGPRLYWASWQGDGADSSIEFFFRARDREAAKAETIRRHPGARFYR